jgi:hypothetical protein
MTFSTLYIKIIFDLWKTDKNSTQMFPYVKGQPTFSVKGHKINILGFLGRWLQSHLFNSVCESTQTNVI